MKPLQLAAADGLGVVVGRHGRKSGGDIGDSARGSSAFGGAVDTIITIRRPEGNLGPNVRVLESVSRFDGVPSKLYIELKDEGYISLGTEGNVTHRKALEFLRTEAPPSEGDARSIADMAPGAGVGDTTLRKAAEELIEVDEIRRIGGGRKGDPYRYFLSSAPKGGVAEERISVPHAADTRTVVGAQTEGDALEKLSSRTPTLVAEESFSEGSRDAETDDQYDELRIR